MFTKLGLLLALTLLSSCTSVKSTKSEVIKNADFQSGDKYIKDKKFCYSSCPVVDNNNIFINHGDYVLSYNIKTKYADWVAYKINKHNSSGNNTNRIWRIDPKLPTDVAMIPSDYKDAARICNYDRGHQAPLADFSNSPNWEKVNYLSNITPQIASLNRGPWYNLESKIRHLGLKTNGQLYVITGPYYTDKPMCKLPNARIKNIVPNGYWKIVTLVTNNEVYRASFKFDQYIPKKANFCNHSINIQDISKITNLKFTHNNKTENSEELLNMLGCST